MKGILFAIIAGAFISLHGVFNAKMSQTISTWHTITLVHFVGFFIALGFYAVYRDGSIKQLPQVPVLYLLGGTFGVIIVLGEMTAINLMGMSLAIALLMIAQLLCAFLIECLGLFEVNRLAVKKHHIAGMLLMISGIVIFQL